MRIDEPMFPPLPAASPIPSVPAAPDGACAPPPAKPKAKRRRRQRPLLKRRRGVYYPTNATIEEFFKAYDKPPLAGDVRTRLRVAESATLSEPAELPSVNSEPGELRVLDDDSTIGALLGGGAIGRITRQLEARGELPGIPSALLLLARLREEAAATVDGLLTFLDETELEADIELDSDENDADLVDDEEDDGTGEPWLGSIERHPSEYNARDIESEWTQPRLSTSAGGDQYGWSDGDRDDLEDEHDGSEPDVDDEPSLGSFEAMANQADAWRADNPWNIVDGEEDPAEAGIADVDGLAEQVGRPRKPSREGMARGGPC